jgi:CubicO group peptidase (beta-lactamase class C family)
MEISVRLLKVLSVQMLLVAAPACADEFETVRAQIREVMDFHNVPSVSVAVARNGKIIWEESFGWADLERHILATPHTLYSLASITKPVTATALMTLVERHQIDLDKPMNDYLGTQKLAGVGDAREATVRRVAEHTAGVMAHASWFYADQPNAHPHMDETIRRYGTLASVPGELYSYSNLDYGLLEYAIERVSGKSYAEFVQKQVFEPLGLTESAIYDASRSDNGPLASRYWFGYHKVPAYDVDSRGASAVLMSAHDLVRFGIFQLSGHLDGEQRSVLRKETLLAMRVPPLLPAGEKSSYALGWEVEERHGLKWFGHGGGSAGVVSWLSVYPDEGLVVVVLGNGVSETGAIHFLENDIVHAVLPDTIRHDHGFKPHPEQVGRWIGEIQFDGAKIPLTLRVNANGSVLIDLPAAVTQEVTDVQMDDKTGVLSLDHIRGTIPLSGITDTRYRIQLTLKLREGVLSGSICANALESLPDRMGNLTCAWTHLQRVTAQTVGP